MSNKMMKIEDALSEYVEVKLDDLVSWNTNSGVNGSYYIVLFFKNHVPITLHFKTASKKNTLIKHLERVMPVALCIRTSKGYVEHSCWTEGD